MRYLAAICLLLGTTAVFAQDARSPHPAPPKRPAAVPQVLVQVTIVELREPGENEEPGLEAPDALAKIAGGDSSLPGWLGQLLKDRKAIVLAEPIIVTTAGRPARFATGGDVRVRGSAPPRVQKAGCEVEFVPTLEPDGRIRLGLMARYRDINPDRNLAIDTVLAARPGQTLLVGWISSTREDQTPRTEALPETPEGCRQAATNTKTARDTLVLIRAELLKPANAKAGPEN